MAPLKNVVVVGASKSGIINLGSYIVEALKSDPEFTVTVVSRKSTPSSAHPDGVRVVQVDDGYPPEELERAFAGQDAVVMATSFQVYGQEGKFVDAAIKAGVKRFIPSEYGGDTANAKTVAIFPMIGMRAQHIEHLKTKESAGLSWTAICTGLFVDVALKTGFLGFDLQGQRATVWDDGKYKFSGITRENVARAVVGVLKNPDITANRHVYVSSFEASLNDLVATAEKIQDTRYSILHTSTETEAEAARNALASGNFMAAAKLLLVATLNPGYGSNFADEGHLWNDKLGVPRENLTEVVARVIQN
ncbi:hypothetical protein G7054_g7593 [Neopestalotiopsis clavispora]|nr:hypothetical protein G7054_g7593 [Neopestalotiopsis clavispora]